MERRHALWIISAAISLIVAACGSSPTTPTPSAAVVPPTAPAVTVTTVTVTNTGTTGASFQLGAMARLSDGSVLDVTRVAAWDSSDTTRAIVSLTGFVTVMGDGDVDVHAVYRGVPGSAHLTVELPKTYTVSGIVRATTLDGSAIAGAQVRVLDATSGALIVTNASGAFTTSALATGRHLVEVSKPGYQVWETEIMIVDRDLAISVALIPMGS